ncbi:hypothetical protein [Mycobacterium leprae]
MSNNRTVVVATHHLPKDFGYDELRIGAVKSSLRIPTPTGATNDD